MDICKWPLGNNESLQFVICVKNTKWNAVAGLYIFAYATDQTHWQAVYVGQTDDFSSRIPSHEQWVPKLWPAIKSTIMLDAHTD